MPSVRSARSRSFEVHALSISAARCDHEPMHLVTRALLGTVVTRRRRCWRTSAGYEVRSFRLRRVTVPVLAPGQRAARVLQVTDLHMTPGQKKKQEWVRSLAALEPDLVIDTGDNLAHLEAVPSVLRRARAAAGAARRVRARVQRLSTRPCPRTPRATCVPDDGVAQPDHRAALARPARRAARRRLGRPHQRARPASSSASREVELVGVDDPHICARPLRRRRRARVAGRRPRPRRRPRAVPPGRRRDGCRRAAAGAGRAHPRRAAAGAVLRRARRQLRPRPEAGARACRGTPTSTSGCTCRPGSVRRRTRRSASPARPRRRSSPWSPATDRHRCGSRLGGRLALGYPARAPSGCSAAW